MANDRFHTEIYIRNGTASFAYLDPSFDAWFEIENHALARLQRCPGVRRPGKPATRHGSACLAKRGPELLRKQNKYSPVSSYHIFCCANQPFAKTGPGLQIQKAKPYDMNRLCCVHSVCVRTCMASVSPTVLSGFPMFVPSLAW